MENRKKAMLETYRIIPSVTGVNLRDRHRKKTMWFLMNGSSSISSHLSVCPDINLDKAARRYRMFVMKPPGMGGHFYDVTFNGRYHVLMQLSGKEELPFITDIMAQSLVIDRDEDKPTSCAILEVKCVCPSYMLYVKAKRSRVCWMLDYYGLDAKDTWSVPPSTEDQLDLRTLEIYTYDDGVNLKQCLSLAGM